MKPCECAQIKMVMGISIRVGSKITKRERAVLELLADGRMSDEIAHSLSISPRTVEVYRGRIKARLNARNTAHAISLAYKSGVLKIVEEV